MSRLGNTLFFVGLVLAALAAILFSASESANLPIVLIGCVAIALMSYGGWLWFRFAPPPEPVTPIVVEPRSPAKVRLLGVIKLIAGGSLFGASLHLLSSTGAGKEQARGIGELIALAAPGGFALVGLLECTTGVQFARFSAKWDSLKPWQRGVIVFLTIVSCFALVIVGIPLLYGNLN